MTNHQLIAVIDGLLAIFPWKDSSGKEHPEVTAARAAIVTHHKQETAMTTLTTATKAKRVTDAMMALAAEYAHEEDTARRQRTVTVARICNDMDTETKAKLFDALQVLQAAP